MGKLFILFVAVFTFLALGLLIAGEPAFTGLRSKNKFFNWTGTNADCEGRCTRASGVVCGNRDKNCCFPGFCEKSWGGMRHDCKRRMNIDRCTSGGFAPTSAPINTGYTTGQTGYGVGQTGYGVGQTGYGVGQTGYGVGQTGYGVGQTGYGVGQTGYGVGQTGYGVGQTGYGVGQVGGASDHKRCKDACKNNGGKSCDVSGRGDTCCRRGCTGKTGCDYNGQLVLSGCPTFY